MKRRTGVEYVAMHNRMLIAFFRLLWASLQSGMDVWFENPADALPATLPDGSPNPFHHPRASRSASLFRFDETVDVTSAYPGAFVRFVQCALGSQFWKPTCVWSTGLIAESMRWLDGAPCHCVPGSHRKARGSASRASQEYPDGLSSPLGMGMVRANQAVRAASWARGTRCCSPSTTSSCVRCRSDGAMRMAQRWSVS